MGRAMELVKAVLAYLLLILYVATVRYLILKVLACAHTSGCETVNIPDGMLYVVTTIGGFISALVVASLALSPSKKKLSIAGLTTGGAGISGGAVGFLTWLYLGAWAITGLAALVIGEMLHPNINRTLADIGTSWLGLAVMAGYAYFGITPPAEG